MRAVFKDRGSPWQLLLKAQSEQKHFVRKKSRQNYTMLCNRYFLIFYDIVEKILFLHINPGAPALRNTGAPGAGQCGHFRLSR